MLSPEGVSLGGLAEARAAASTGVSLSPAQPFPPATSQNQLAVSGATLNSVVSASKSRGGKRDAGGGRIRGAGVGLTALLGIPGRVLGSEALSLQELAGFLPVSKQQFPLQQDLAAKYRSDELTLVTQLGFSPLRVRKLRHGVTRRAGAEPEQPGPISPHAHRPPPAQPRTWWCYILPLPAFSAAAWAPPGPAAPGTAAWDLPRCQALPRSLAAPRYSAER